MYFKLCGAVPNSYVAFKSKNYVSNIIASLFLVQHINTAVLYIPTKYWFENVETIQCKYTIPTES